MAGLDDAYEDAGKAWNVDPRLIRAMHSGESGFDDNAKSNKGALGRGQFMPDTARAIGMTNPNDPLQAIYGTAKLMRQNLDASNGDVATALRLYQGGPDRSKWGPQNAAYVPYIMSHYQKVGAAPASSATPAAASAPADGPSDDAIIAALTKGAPASGAPAAAAPAAAPANGQMSDDDIIKALTASGPKQETAPAAVPGQAQPTYIDPTQLLEQRRQNIVAAEQVKPAGQRDQEFLAPAPNTTYSSILPVAVDDTTGQPRMALPSSLRDLAKGIYNLGVEGPSTGTISPEGTAALFAGATGGLGGAIGNRLAPSVARGTGEAIANRLLPPGDPALGRNAPGDLLGRDFRAAPFMAGASPQNRLAAAMIPEMDAMGNPTGGMIAAPNSVGAAATPSNLTPMGAREAAASQATGENFRLANPRSAPGRDATEYVPGVKPTEAEISGNADVAANQKYISQTPGEKEKFVARQRENNSARLDYYDEAAGTPTIVNTMKEARAVQAEKDLAAAWGKTKPVDAAPIVAQIDQALAGPDGKLSAVSGALGKVRELLYNSKGELETDPQVLYGARREIANMLGKAAQQEKPTLRDAARNLEGVRQSLDEAIESGAPGYRAYLDNYSQASKPIDTMELLQEARPGLTNAAGNLTYSSMSRLMKGIVAQRQASGINPAKSLDDAAMDRLWNIYADLHRTQMADVAAKAQGSDTSMLGRIGNGLTSAITKGGLAFLPGGPVISMAMTEAARARGERAAGRQVNRLLNPPADPP